VLNKFYIKIISTTMKDHINNYEGFHEEIEIQKESKVKTWNLSVHFSALCKSIYLILIAQLK